MKEKMLPYDDLPPSCPKCGATYDLISRHYKKVVGAEYLNLYCQICGHDRRMKTKDAK